MEQKIPTNPELAAPQSLLFGLEQARAGYLLTKLARSMTKEENRRAFLADQEGHMRDLGLSNEQIRLVLEQDWYGLQAAGCNQYALVKLAGTLGVSLLQEGAKLRGESLETFLASRPLYANKA